MRKKFSLLLISLFTLISSSYSQTTNTVRRQECFNNDWRFTLGDNPDYRETNFNDSEWRLLNVPHDWTIEGGYDPKRIGGNFNGYFSEEGLGWYRKTFNVAQEDANKQFVIQFDGVFMDAEVWINGVYLGNRPFGYSTFRFDLTANLKFGAENTIAVRVDNSKPSADRWYHGSGIYRDVHLLVTNYVHFKHNGGVFISTPTAEAERAMVKVEYDLMGSFFNDDELKTHKRNAWNRTESKWKSDPKPHDCVIRSIVYDKDGKEVARKENKHTIYNYEMDYKATQYVSFDDPNRWSDKNPYLYTMRSEIEYDGKILDDVVTKFGVRKIEYIPNRGLLVNGEVTKLWGVCLHHDAGSLGAAVPEKSIVYRLEKLKAMGCNAIRTAHNPFAPNFYDVCDSLGIYVQNESFDEWTCGWAVNWTENPTGKALNGYNHLFTQWAETDLRDMIKRDRNHPSVLIYTIGNEIPDQRHYKDVAKTASRLVAIAHEEDPTRPVCVGDNNSLISSKNGLAETLDILGYNYIERDYSTEMYDVIHEMYPEKLIFGSEVNKELGYHLAVRDRDYVIGGFIWTGIDYLGETKEKTRRGWNTSLLDLTLNKRADGAMFECCWTEEPRVFITTSGQTSVGAEDNFEIFSQGGERVFLNEEKLFSWNREEGSTNYIYVYSNCDEIALYQNGKLLGRKPCDKNAYGVEFKTTFKPGKLTAVAYRNGKKVATDVLETTGEAEAIVAKPYWKTLARDGRDIAIIEIDLVDSKGRTVPTATNVVEVKIEGGARLLGIDSPNLYYQGNFKASKRDAMNGKLMVTIQSNGKDLPSKITLTSDDLKSTTVEL